MRLSHCMESFVSKKVVMTEMGEENPTQIVSFDDLLCLKWKVSI